MTKPIITIRQATPDDKAKVTQFRIDQFRTAKEFEVVNTKLFSEMKGQVLIAELDNEKAKQRLAQEKFYGKMNMACFAE